MKKTLLLFALLLGVCMSVMAQVVVSGDITTNTTWTKNNTYLLSGFVYVTNSAVLTIEPGTVIKGDKSSKGTLIITRGSQIRADGTPSEPIVFTSNEATPSYGDWGGLIILGYAPTNQVYSGTSGLGLIEGGIDAVKGLYGGGDQTGGAKADDNSGILRYVRVEYPGIAFQPNNEINGITFGGVGNKTLVDYVQVSYAGDDSYEWFGGTVNCRHLVAYRGLDDDFDTDNGYAGNIQFALSVRDPQVADVSGSNGFESDNNATGTGAGPKTKPTFSNVTVVGPPTATANANYKRGAHLRRNTEQGIYNSLTIGVWPDAGLLIDGDSSANNATNGKLVVRNSFIYGAPTALKTTVASFNINNWAADKNITSSANVADAKLTDPFNLNLPNARPLSGSPVLSAANFTSDARIKDAFFVPVTYAGAFAFGDDWTCPWSKFATAGCLPPVTPTEAIISSDITTDTKWTADKTYTLQGFIYVTNCAKLTIEPGTVIKGDKGSKGALIVTRCAQILADGTAAAPIVFTSAEATPSYGDWGGLIILGYAPTNQVYNGTAGLGLIEGGLDPVKGLYGGGDQPGGAKAEDNSGILRYVRVEYSGIAFQPNNEINGITFGSVGNKTVVDYVQVSYCADDSYEFFGGTVNCKHLIAYRGLDDDFDTDNGYAGDIQFALAVRDPQVADVSGSNSFESDNNATGTGAKPKTRPTFSNVTVVGVNSLTFNANYKRGAHLRRNTELGLFNSLILGNWPDAGLLIDGDSCTNNATAGRLEVKNTYITSPTPLKTTVASFNIATWFGTAGFSNATSTVVTSGNLQDAFNLDAPNAQPTLTSPAVLPSAASFTSARVNKPFFDKVTYAGAFNGSKAGDWTCGWAKFKTLNTNCFFTSGTQDADKSITELRLYPTVANDQVTLELNLVNSADLRVDVYGINGQYFGQVVNEKAPAGEQAYRINVANLTAGFYFFRVQAGAAVKTEKLIIVR